MQVNHDSPPSCDAKHRQSSSRPGRFPARRSPEKQSQKRSLQTGSVSGACSAVLLARDPIIWHVAARGAKQSHSPCFACGCHTVYGSTCDVLSDELPPLLAAGPSLEAGSRTASMFSRLQSSLGGLSTGPRRQTDTPDRPGEQASDASDSEVCRCRVAPTVALRKEHWATNKQQKMERRMLMRSEQDIQLSAVIKL